MPWSSSRGSLGRAEVAWEFGQAQSCEALVEAVGRECTKEPTEERRARYVGHIVNCEVLPHEGLQGTPEVLAALSATFSQFPSGASF